MSNARAAGQICSSIETIAFPNPRGVSSGEETVNSATLTAAKTETRRIRRRPSRPEATRKIERSLIHMLQHLDEPLRVATLSAMSGLSASVYSSLFKCATGHAPIDFFIRMRMHRACELLQETTLGVKEVAAALGYSDPFYFSRIFKSVNGIAPSFYRLRIIKSGRTETEAARLRFENDIAESFLPPHSSFSKYFKSPAAMGNAPKKQNGISAT